MLQSLFTRDLHDTKEAALLYSSSAFLQVRIGHGISILTLQHRVTVSKRLFLNVIVCFDIYVDPIKIIIPTLFRHFARLLLLVSISFFHFISNTTIEVNSYNYCRGLKFDAPIVTYCENAVNVYRLCVDLI